MPGIPEDAERGGNRGEIRIQLAKLFSVGNGIFLPAPVAFENVADLKFRILRLHYLADGAADHHLADIHGIGIGL